MGERLLSCLVAAVLCGCTSLASPTADPAPASLQETPSATPTPIAGERRAVGIRGARQPDRVGGSLRRCRGPRDPGARGDRMSGWRGPRLVTHQPPRVPPLHRAAQPGAGCRDGISADCPGRRLGALVRDGPLRDVGRRCLAHPERSELLLPRHGVRRREPAGGGIGGAPIASDRGRRPGSVDGRGRGRRQVAHRLDRCSEDWTPASAPTAC